MNNSTTAASAEEIEISFIVPIYNAEEYILDCLKSITDQGIDNIEVLCVDDFSTDNSAAIVHKECLKDQRIKLLRHTSNHGAPTARNSAIEKSRGKYLAFVDADDVLCKGSFASLYRQAENTGAEAVKGLMLVTSNHHSLKPHPLNQTQEWPNTNLFDCPEIQHLYHYTTYLFRASVIRDNNLLFDTSLTNFQDPEFLSRLLPACTTINITLVPTYIRVIRRDSIVSSPWRYANFDSFIRSTLMAFQHLNDIGQHSAAKLMSQNCLRWWYKLETMPNTLSRHECIVIYKLIGELCQASSWPIYRFSFTKAGAYHALRLVDRKSHERCYEVMSTSLSVKKRFSKPVAKLYDLYVLSLDLLLRRV